MTQAPIHNYDGPILLSFTETSFEGFMHSFSQEYKAFLPELLLEEIEMRTRLVRPNRYHEASIQESAVNPNTLQRINRNNARKKADLMIDLSPEIVARYNPNNNSIRIFSSSTITVIQLTTYGAQMISHQAPEKKESTLLKTHRSFCFALVQKLNNLHAEKLGARKVVI